MQEMSNFKWIPLYSSENWIETGKYTTMFTDVWNFEINMSLEDLQKEIKKDSLFKYKKLEEYSKILEHHWELVLDLNSIKVMWYKEHTLIDNLNERKNLKTKEKLWTD